MGPVPFAQLHQFVSGRRGSTEASQPLRWPSIALSSACASGDWPNEVSKRLGKMGGCGFSGGNRGCVPSVRSTICAINAGAAAARKAMSGHRHVVSQLAAAWALLERALAIRAKVLGPDHLDTASRRALDSRFSSEQ